MLGEYSLFILKERGGLIRFQKRYSFSPACLITYHLRSEGDDLIVDAETSKEEIIDRAAIEGLKTPGFMTMLGSFEGYLMVYKDTKLAWTTKL